MRVLVPLADPAGGQHGHERRDRSAGAVSDPLRACGLADRAALEVREGAAPLAAHALIVRVEMPVIHPGLAGISHGLILSMRWRRGVSRAPARLPGFTNEFAYGFAQSSNVARTKC